jgi:hypothetical protein
MHEPVRYVKYIELYYLKKICFYYKVENISTFYIDVGSSTQLSVYLE